MPKKNIIHHANCLDKLPELPSNSIAVIYCDPPFFTQKKHRLTTRDNTQQYEFSDSWASLEVYLAMLESCLRECKRILQPTGSLFLHCDKMASHHLRLLLDKVFGTKNFRSEIIWSYKRWSNAKKGLLNVHQNIYFYSKSNQFKFNKIYTEYAPSTNVDQIWQERARTKQGKSVYKKDKEGNVVLGKEKKGVPLSDVWDIPYLNPKAKERVGYPTQKPVLLLKQIIKIASDEGDCILDPFCGSGTTCVAAKSMNRDYIGIDQSKDAVALSKRRLETMIITESALLKKGAKSYIEKTEEELVLLKSIDAIPVQRNKGIDGFLKSHFANKPVPIKIQSKQETLDDAIEKLERACKGKNYLLKILVQTRGDLGKTRLFSFNPNITIIKSNKLAIETVKRQLKETIS